MLCGILRQSGMLYYNDSLNAGNGVALVNSHFGHGSGPVQLGSVQCVGNENSFLDCPHNSAAHCTSYENAGVVCPSETY